MQGDVTRLAELAVANGQNTVCEVHVVPVEVKYLAGSHARDRQQRQKRHIGQGPEPRGTGQFLRRRDQIGDLPITIDVGLRTAVPVGDQPLRRDLVAWVHGVRITGEAAHQSEPPRPCGGLCMVRLGSPAMGQFGGDEGGLMLTYERNEGPKPPFRVRQPDAKRAARGEILFEQGGEIDHDALPGHAGASMRNASRSTLA